MKKFTTIILSLLFFTQSFGQDYSAKNPKSDFLFEIEEWRYDNISDIEEKFNLARHHESIEVNLDLPSLKFPNNWEKYPIAKKMKWLIDNERKVRNQVPLEEISSKINKLARISTKELVVSLGSEINNLKLGTSVILNNENYKIDKKELREFKLNNEYLDNNQLHAFISNIQDVPIVEMLFFNWMYADSENDWENRDFIINTKFKENGGNPYSEGFLGASLLNFPVLGSKHGIYVLTVQFYDPGNNWNYGIKTNTFENLEFKVHASSGMLTLSTEEVSDSLKVEVYNLLGQQVLQSNVDYRVTNTFNIEGPKGYYLVKLSANAKSKAVKVYIP